MKIQASLPWYLKYHDLRLSEDNGKNDANQTPSSARCKRLALSIRSLRNNSHTQRVPNKNPPRQIHSLNARAEEWISRSSTSLMKQRARGAWIGYTMATTPAPKPIEEITAEDKKEETQEQPTIP